MKRKYYFFWSLLLGLMGVTASAAITSIGDVSTTSIYHIRAKDAARGALYAGNLTNNGGHPEGHLSAAGSTGGYGGSYSDFASIGVDAGDIYQWFAFIQAGGKYYLYNIGTRSFCYASGTKAYFGNSDISAAEVTFVTPTNSAGNGYVLMKFVKTGGYLCFSNNESGQHAIFLNSGVSLNTDDGGDLLNINAVGTFEADEMNYARGLIYSGAADEAQAVLNLSDENSVGYPTSAERTTLANAIANYRAKITAGTIADDDVTTLQTAVSTYKTSTNVNMPQNGKAYTFTFKHMDGTRTYLYWNGSKITSAVLGSEGLPETAKFICRTVTDGGSTKYMFVNNAGKYLVWWGGSGDGAYESNNGYTSAYASAENLFQVIKFTSGSNVQCTNEELFGCVGLKGTRQSGDAPYFILKNTAGGAVASSLAFVDKTTTGSGYRTSAVMIEEAEYPNTVTFKNTDITNESGTPAGTYALATFSAPFATVIPEGVTAYIATQDAGNSDVIHMNAVSGSALPAGAGFILSGTADATVAMVPATDEGQVSTAGSLLVGSAGAPATLSTTNDYVLGQKDGHVAFYHVSSTGNVLPMNRAYLHFSGSSVVKMDFNHTTTGIEALSPATQQDGPIYDLSGRRVSQMSKGGIYIRNGKKVLVK